MFNQQSKKSTYVGTVIKWLKANQHIKERKHILRKHILRPLAVNGRTDSIILRPLAVNGKTGNIVLRPLAVNGRTSNIILSKISSSE